MLKSTRILFGGVKILAVIRWKYEVLFGGVKILVWICLKYEVLFSGTNQNKLIIKKYKVLFFRDFGGLKGEFQKILWSSSSPTPKQLTNQRKTYKTEGVEAIY